MSGAWDDPGQQSQNKNFSRQRIEPAIFCSFCMSGRTHFISGRQNQWNIQCPAAPARTTNIITIIPFLCPHIPVRALQESFEHMTDISFPP